jgi:hypothetical protein
LRKLVVVSDADLLAAPDDAAVTQAALLTGLLTHPFINLLRYRDEEPAACPMTGSRAGAGLALLVIAGSPPIADNAEGARCL